jgi:cell fate (sporulation/competence/biofilm development) regulator YlbF (YheA/YmcA/DUF963 family)
MLKLDAGPTPFVQKLQELCQVLLSQEHFIRLKGQIDAFMADTRAQYMYQALTDKQGLLMDKQRSGMPLSDDEIRDFEVEREALMNNLVCQGFLTAQKELKKIQESVSTYVNLTLEHGRVPTQDEVDTEMRGGGGCCGGGGCGSGGGGGGCGSGGCS